MLHTERFLFRRGQDHPIIRIAEIVFWGDSRPFQPSGIVAFVLALTVRLHIAASHIPVKVIEIHIGQQRR